MRGSRDFKFTVSIACHNNWDLTERCIKSLYNSNKIASFEVIITNNASTDETWVELERERMARQNIRLVHMGLNIGFGEAHNRALSIARGEYFVVLNNDFYVHEEEWLDKLLEPFQVNPKLAICGVKGNPSYLNEEGDGRWHDTILEYVEGSCLAIPVGLAKKHGLFSPEMRFAYYEDSDMSLRYRQMGYDIAVVPFKFEHVRGKTAGLIGKEKLEAVRAANRRRFLLRWGNYLKNRRLSNKILVETRLITGLGDLLCITPALRSLRRAHPTAEIVLETATPEIFRDNPYISSTTKTRPEENLEQEEWDSVLLPGLSAYYQVCITSQGNWLMIWAWS